MSRSQPIVMKKGRPGHLLRIVARPEDREALAQIVFAETTTLGLRIYAAERRVQARSCDRGGNALREGSHQGGGDDSFAPEYEDCRTPGAGLRRAALKRSSPKPTTNT